jgi:hypothetical protein
MPYIVCWRDNIERNILQDWEPVPIKGVFNGDVYNNDFPSEEQVFNWLGSRTRINTGIKTRKQIKMNADPDKLYGIYSYIHNGNYSDPSNDLVYHYTVRLLRPSEQKKKLLDSNNKVINAPFIKVHVNTYNLRERLVNTVPNIPGESNPVNSIINTGSLDHSPSMRVISGEYYEGIYPISYELGLDEDDTTDNASYKLYEDYMSYVNAIHELDDIYEEGMEYDIAFLGDSDRWIDEFYNKLVLIEQYLVLIQNGGQGNFNLEGRTSNNRNILKKASPYTVHRQSLIDKIKTIIKRNTSTFIESTMDSSKLINLISDPFLYDGNLYQVRFRNSTMTWHKGYSQIIRVLRLVPSKEFCEFVVTFNINSFFEQYQTIDRLEKIYSELINIYNEDVHIATTGNDIINKEYTSRNMGNVIRIKRKF